MSTIDGTAAATPFLATTGLRSHWHPGKKLFLAEWCLRELDDTERAAELGAVLPDPWRDCVARESSWADADAVYERLLRRLVDYLNAAHDVDHSPRYWRVLIGPWLRLYVDALYDRELRLSRALAAFPGLWTVLLDARDFQTPFDCSEMSNLLQTDTYNLQIITQLLQVRGFVGPTRNLPPNGDSTARLTHRRQSPRRPGPRSMLDRLLRYRRRSAPIVISDMHLPSHDVRAVCWRSWLRAVPADFASHWSFATPSSATEVHRKALATLGGESAFEQNCSALLPTHFPTLYLEGYADAVAEVQQRYRLPSAAPVSAIGWYYQEPFKFYSAARAEAGGRLVAVQHGAGYGFARRIWNEIHEGEIADRYWVWGWGTGDVMENVPSIKLSRIRERAGTREARSGVLFVATKSVGLDRYPELLNSYPSAQWESYLAAQREFFGAMAEPRRRIVTCRAHFHESDRLAKRRLASQFPDLKWEDSAIPFDRSLRRYRMVVIDHPGTTMLEALTADVPTILFWDPSYWLVRAAAEQHLEQMRDVGILQNTPAAAAAHLERVCDQPASWWRAPAVQETRRRFLGTFGASHQDWRAIWGRKLRALAS